LNLDLLEGTKLQFTRVKHSEKLLDWVNNAKNWISQNQPDSDRKSLYYAFDEYKLILERLGTNQWRKIMTLDQYTLDMKNSEEEKEMYAFMCEAHERLNDYLSKKLYKEINELFPEKIREVLVFPNNAKEFKNFDEPSCNKWFKQTGERKNYQDIGFIFKKGNKTYFFALGNYNISYGLLSEGWKVKTCRRNLQTNKNKNFFDIIDDLRNIGN